MASNKVTSKYRRIIPSGNVYEPDDLEIDDRKPFRYSKYIDEVGWMLAVSSCEKQESPFLMIDKISNANSIPEEAKRFLINLVKKSYKPDGRKSTSNRQFLAHQRLLAFKAGFTSDIGLKSQHEFKSKKELLEYLDITHSLATNSIEKKSETFKKADQNFRLDFKKASRLAKEREQERASKEQKSMDAF